MEIKIKSNNTFELPLQVRVLNGKYVIKSLSIILTADDPYDLPILMKKQKAIEKAIVDELNKGFSATVSLPN